MLGFLQPKEKAVVLDLSGPILRRAYEHLTKAAEQTGGVERYVGAIALKSSLFEEILAKGNVQEMDVDEFCDLATFITPVRRRMAGEMSEKNMTHLIKVIVALMEGWNDVSTTDARMAAFVAAFPEDKKHRWVRDLGAEILHYAAPQYYPLMTRWVWDNKVGSGVLREIWHSSRIDQEKIDVPDNFTNFVLLRDEMVGFLRENGVFCNLEFYCDLLCAHIYAGYINEMGGQYLRSEFVECPDPMLHTRRMLGLDAIDTETGRTRLKLIDGDAHTLGGEALKTNQLLN